MLEQAKLIYGGRKNSGCLWERVEVGMTDMEISGVTEIFYILLEVWVTHLYALSTFIEFCAFLGNC